MDSFDPDNSLAGQHHTRVIAGGAYWLAWNRARLGLVVTNEQVPTTQATAGRMRIACFSKPTSNSDSFWYPVLDHMKTRILRFLLPAILVAAGAGSVAWTWALAQHVDSSNQPVNSRQPESIDSTDSSTNWPGTSSLRRVGTDRQRDADIHE